MSKKKIRKLKGNEDFYELFKCHEEKDMVEEQKDPLLNKHGLPVIEKSFGTLKGKSHADLLMEKGIEKRGKKQTLTKKIKNYPPPEVELDLHGETALSASLKAENFVRLSISKGYLTLRVIVGKGLHSEFGAVLPDTIEDLLVKLKLEKTVLSYRWEKGTKKKSGAVIVYLP